MNMAANIVFQKNLRYKLKQKFRNDWHAYTERRMWTTCLYAFIHTNKHVYTSTLAYMYCFEELFILHLYHIFSLLSNIILNISYSLLSLHLSPTQPSIQPNIQCPLSKSQAFEIQFTEQFNWQFTPYFPTGQPVIENNIIMRNI